MQALLQSNARVDAVDSDGYDPGRDHLSRFHGRECLRVGELRWKPTILRVWSGFTAESRVDGNRGPWGC